MSSSRIELEDSLIGSNALLSNHGKDQSINAPMKVTVCRFVNTVLVRASRSVVMADIVLNVQVFELAIIWVATGCCYSLQSFLCHVDNVNNRQQLVNGHVDYLILAIYIYKPADPNVVTYLPLGVVLSGGAPPCPVCNLA